MLRFFAAPRLALPAYFQNRAILLPVASPRIIKNTLHTLRKRL
jgi:hypothetical protein